MRICILVMAVLCATNAYALKFFEPGQGLPDYAANPPFTNWNGTTSRALTKAIADIVPADLKPIETPCNAGSVLIKKAPLYEGDTAGKDWFQALHTNICNTVKLAALRTALVQIAPTFHAENLTAWVVDLEGNGSKDLLVGYMELSKDEPFRYPYLSLWRFRSSGDSFTTRNIGPFLAGDVHAVESFGESSKNKIVFVSWLSCLECEPLVYLTPVDFDSGNDAKPYEFTYSDPKDGYYPSIEYVLPGMGHTVDADVEVRILPPSSKGPHLLQHYKIEPDEGPSEWWEFSCQDYKCDYKEYKGKVPEAFHRLWVVAKRI